MRQLVLRGCLIALLWLAWPVVGQPDATADLRLFDRLVAVVDDDPIFLSDLGTARELAAMGPRSGEGVAGESPAVITDRRLLDRMIDRRLRLHEVERYGDQAVSSSVVEQSLAEAERQAGGADALDRRLAESKLDRNALRELLRRQIRVLIHIEQRIGARIFVDEDEVRAYYDTTLKSEMVRQGSPRPPFEEVADGIRALLREQALNREIQVWTDELRQEARIVDLLDETPMPDDLPPVVLKLEAESS